MLPPADTHGSDGLDGLVPIPLVVDEDELIPGALVSESETPVAVAHAIPADTHGPDGLDELLPIPLIVLDEDELTPGAPVAVAHAIPSVTETLARLSKLKTLTDEELALFYLQLHSLLSRFHTYAKAFPSSNISRFRIFDSRSERCDTAYWRMDDKTLNIALTFLQAIEFDIVGIEAVVGHETGHSSFTTSWMEAKQLHGIRSLLLNHLEDWRINTFLVRNFPHLREGFDIVYTAAFKNGARQFTVTENKQQFVLWLWHEISRHSYYPNFETQVEFILNRPTFTSEQRELLARIKPHILGFQRCQPNFFNRDIIRAQSKEAVAHAQRIFDILEEEKVFPVTLTPEKFLKLLKDLITERKKSDAKKDEPKKPEDKAGSPPPKPDEAPADAQPKPAEGEKAPEAGEKKADAGGAKPESSEKPGEPAEGAKPDEPNGDTEAKPNKPGEAKTADAEGDKPGESEGADGKEKSAAADKSKESDGDSSADVEGDDKGDKPGESEGADGADGKGKEKPAAADKSGDGAAAEADEASGKPGEKPGEGEAAGEGDGEKGEAAKSDSASGEGKGKGEAGAGEGAAGNPSGEGGEPGSSTYDHPSPTPSSKSDPGATESSAPSSPAPKSDGGAAPTTPQPCDAGESESKAAREPAEGDKPEGTPSPNPLTPPEKETWDDLDTLGTDQLEAMRDALERMAGADTPKPADAKEESEEELRQALKDAEARDSAKADDSEGKLDPFKDTVKITTAANAGGDTPYGSFAGYVDPVDVHYYDEYIAKWRPTVSRLVRLFANAKSEASFEQGHKMRARALGNRLRIKAVVRKLSNPGLSESKIFNAREGELTRGHAVMNFEDVLMGIDGSGSMMSTIGVAQTMAGLIYLALQRAKTRCAIASTVRDRPYLICKGNKLERPEPVIRRLGGLKGSGDVDMANGSIQVLHSLQRPGANPKKSRLTIFSDCCAVERDMVGVATTAKKIGYPICVVAITGGSYALGAKKYMPNASFIQTSGETSPETIWKVMQVFSKWMADPETFYRSIQKTSGVCQV